MPELPEVEVTRRSISPGLTGATVISAHLGKPLRWPLGCTPASLAGRMLAAPQRRGKYLWLPLGAKPDMPQPAPGGLLLHLGMSGSLAFAADPAAAGAHDHFDLVTDRGTLRLTDPRRFGAVVWSDDLDTPPAASLLGRLGFEPFDAALTAAAFHAALKKRRSPIKAVLLGGELIVGAGNIYACEALHHAGIHPRLRAESISRPRAERLLAALRLILARAIDIGGSTLRDFRDAHGAAGAFQLEAAVYGRAGLPCPRCAAPVQRIVQAQRATYFCQACQKR